MFGIFFFFFFFFFFGVTAVAGLSIVGATLAASSSAEAHYSHSSWGGGWMVGPAVVGGLALGALAASRPYYGYPHMAIPMDASEIGWLATRLTPPDHSSRQRLLLEASTRTNNL